jgi:hypothetical protein
MNRMTYDLRLYHGYWKVNPTRAVITCSLKRAFYGRPWDRVEAVSFRLPDDGEHDEGVCLVVHVEVGSESSDAELLGDILYEALISRLAPEYDSLLEVERDTALV